MPDEDHEFRRPSGYTDREVAQLLTDVLSPDPQDLPAAYRPSREEILRFMLLQRRRRKSRSIVRYAAVIAAVVLMSGGMWQLGGLRDAGRVPAPVVASQEPLPLALADPATWSAARPALTALSAAVAGQPDPGPAGRYTHVRTRLWARDATDANAVPVVHDEQRWWATDLSGRQTRASVTGWAPGAEPGAAPLPDPGQDVTYEPGGMPVVVPRLSDNVFVLSSQLAERQDPADGPQATLRAVRDVYRYHVPGPRQRAALLQALADTDGLRSAGSVDGGPGRRGLAVVVDSDGATVRDIAVFSPTTGALIAYDTVWLQPPPSVNMPTPTVSDSLLIIEATHTSNPY